MKEGIGLYDLAYGCFLFFGLGVLSMGALDTPDPGQSNAIFLALFIALPLFGIAGVAGILLGIQLRKHRPLLALSVMSALFGAAFFQFIQTDTLTSERFGLIATTYGVVVVVICGAWFLILRAGWSREAPKA